MSSTKKRTVKLSSISKVMKVGKRKKDMPKLPLKGFKRPKNLNISKSKPLLFKPSEIKLKKVKTTQNLKKNLAAIGDKDYEPMVVEHRS